MQIEMTPAKAYDIASNWGSYMTAGDPGACFYGFRFGDGRPVSEAHRVDCLTYARTLLNRGVDEADEPELRALIEFHANCDLNPCD